jgi:hypothetical protein
MCGPADMNALDACIMRIVLFSAAGSGVYLGSLLRHEIPRLRSLIRKSVQQHLRQNSHAFDQENLINLKKSSLHA